MPKTAAPHPCDCHHPISGGPVPGALWPTGTNGDRSRPWVEACADCKTFATDDDAAAAIAAALKTTVAWAIPAGLEGLHPFVDVPKAETTKIYVVAPTDDSQELAAFTEEQDADRFAETFEGGGPLGEGTQVEEVILCSGKAARQMTIDRRQAAYDEIGEAPEQEIEPEDLGRYVVSCGTVHGGREVIHVTGETESQALEAAAEEIGDGWIPTEIHDLNTGSCRQLEVTTAVRPIG